MPAANTSRPSSSRTTAAPPARRRARAPAAVQTSDDDSSGDDAVGVRAGRAGTPRPPRRQRDSSPDVDTRNILAAPPSTRAARYNPQLTAEERRRFLEARDEGSSDDSDWSLRGSSDSEYISSSEDEE